MKRVLFPAVLLALFLAGCSAPQTLALRNAPAVAEPDVVEIREVPFFAQDDHQCGPAALATMLGFAGRKVTPADISAQVYTPGRKGSLAIELAAAARRQGRLVYSIAPQLEAVLAALHQGYPVLVLQNNGLSLIPVWHYAVVVGADRRRETFILRSGTNERLELPFATFERTWARSGYFGFLLFDPSGIPENLDARAVIRELALMERAGAVADAQAGFNRALLNWPDQKTAWLGLASTSMQLGQMERAESVLRELVRRAPQYGAGLNNLADLLLRTGRPLEALPMAERAVGVLDIPETRATLAAAHQAMEPIKSEALPAQAGDIPPAEIQPVAVATPVHKATTKAKKKRKSHKTSARAATSSPAARPAKEARSGQGG